MKVNIGNLTILIDVLLKMVNALEQKKMLKFGWIL
nr:MAG TPA: hypothetical protein [Caudoviricetes sp.]